MSPVFIPWGDVASIAGAVGCVAYVAVRFAVNAVVSRLDRMEQSIGSAHDRIDRHITEWHRGK